MSTWNLIKSESREIEAVVDYASQGHLGLKEGVRVGGRESVKAAYIESTESF